MAPKSGKGKGAAKDTKGKEMPESEAAVRQAQSAYFVPSSVNAFQLRDYFRPLWGAATSAHPATHALPADCDRGVGEADPRTPMGLADRAPFGSAGGGDRMKSGSRRSTQAVYPASELSGEITLLLLHV